MSCLQNYHCSEKSIFHKSKHIITNSQGRRKVGGRRERGTIAPLPFPFFDRPFSNQGSWLCPPKYHWPPRFLCKSCKIYSQRYRNVGCGWGHCLPYPHLLTDPVTLFHPRGQIMPLQIFVRKPWNVFHGFAVWRTEKKKHRGVIDVEVPDIDKLPSE